MKPNSLKECTVLGAKIQDDIVLAKNRDRNYYPKIKIVHELINEDLRKTMIQKLK